MKVIFLILLGPFLGPVTGHSTPRSYTKEYGEPCNKVEKCNYRHWLKCSPSDSVCDCVAPEQMVFVESSKLLSFFSSRSSLLEKKSCRARVNQPCKRDFYTDDDDNQISAPPLAKPQESSMMKQSQLCVENAFCHAHGVCKCRFDYAPNHREGTCYKYREFSEICDRDSQCHPDRFLKCRRQTCQCDPLLRYDREQRKCSAGPGDKCVMSLNQRGKIVDNCGGNGTCHMGQCKCVRGFVPELKERVCVRDYGYACSEREPCVEFFKDEFVCENSTCVCNQEPVPSVYDESLQACARVSSSRGRETQRSLAWWELVLGFIASLLL